MNKLYNDTAVQAIANAIRAKNGSSDTYTIAEMSTALNDIGYYAKSTIENVPLATFEADGLPLNSLKVSVEAKQASGVPSPSNPLPISGWDAANVSEVGKNFLNVPQTVTSGSVTFNRDADGYCTATPSDSDNRSWSKTNAQYSLWLKSGSYKFIWDVKTASTSSASGWTLYDEAGDAVSYGNGFATSGSTTFTTQTDGTYYLQCKIHNSVVRFMVVLADETDTTYEPYNGVTTTISLPQTVYGGEVDVVNGELKITDGYIASYNGETLPSTWISSMDVYAEGTTPTTGAEVCYELAEPIIIPLTPTLIKSLNGTNNLSVDSGDVIELEYFKEV